MVTLQDIADRTGFSRSVVSRALNPCPDQLVAPRTREIIQAAGRALNYRPNQAARLLAQGNSPAIGMFLPVGLDELVARLTGALTAVANRFGFPYNIYFGVDDRDYLAFLKPLHHSRPAGIVTYPPQGLSNCEIPEILRTLRANKCEVVVINGQNDLGPAARQLSIDNRFGGQLAAERLLNTGCRSFCVFTKTACGQEEERLRGFVETVSAAGKSATRTQWFYDSLRPPAGDELRKAVDILIDAPAPVGVFAGSDLAALSIYGGLAARGLTAEIGSRFRIIGFDNSPSARLAVPRLTSIAQPFDALGELGMGLLLNRLVNAELPIDVERLKPTLIIRESA